MKTVLDGLSGAAPLLGVLGFLLALALGILELWKTVWRKSRFEVHVDWIEHAGPTLFSMWVANIGWKKDTVVEIRFQASDTPPDAGWTPFVRSLPIVLDVDEASPRMYVHTGGKEKLPELLREGRIDRLVIVNPRQRKTVATVPLPPS